MLAKELESLTSIETRITVLGYLQRGGDPSAYDRILSTRFGAAAVKMIHNGEVNRMVCMDQHTIKSIPLHETAGRIRVVPPGSEITEIARDMGVSFGD